MKKISSFFGFFLFFVIFLLNFSTAYATTIDRIIVFGDSLSDNGNLFSFTTKAKKALPFIPIVPKNPPYFEGRFSNGPVWVDDLSMALNLKLDNYAYGGAWVEPLKDSRLNIPFSLGLQVDYYLVSAATDFEKANHLYIIWAGGNDYLPGRPDPDYATTNTVANIQKQIEWLVYYGAKNFLILTLPDLGRVPEVVSKGPEFSQAATQLTKLHNSKLIKMVDYEKAQYPEVKFIFLDVTNYFDDIVQHPEKYHLKNIKDACYGGGFWLAKSAMNSKEIQAANEAHLDLINNPSLRVAYLNSIEPNEKPCENQDEYMFWDKVHPTRVIHQAVATLSLAALEENDIHI